MREFITLLFILFTAWSPLFAVIFFIIYGLRDELSRNKKVLILAVCVPILCWFGYAMQKALTIVLSFNSIPLL